MSRHDVRTAAINKQTIWYANKTTRVANVDGSGDKTGEYTINYADPVSFSINLSGAKGDNRLDQFGISVNYDKVAVTGDRDLPWTENTRFWVDVTPVIETDGSTNTPHDMRLAAKDCTTINHAMYALRYENVGA